MLLGEWPTRDFVDRGTPLMYAASAGAQRLFGRTFFAEAMLVVFALSTASAAVFFAAWQVSRSRAAALGAGILSIVAFPRPYGYPKYLLYAVVPLLVWAWIRRPTTSRLVPVALMVAIAFLFRHDHGVYLGFATLLTIGLMPTTAGSTNWPRLLIFSALVLVFLAPYLAYVQVHDGVVRYFIDGISFSMREADRTQLSASAIAAGDEARVYYTVRALAWAGFVWLVFEWRRRHWTIDELMGVPLVVAALLVNSAFLRDPLPARLPDVVVPAVLVAAWLVGKIRALPSRLLRIASLVVLTGAMGASAASLAVLEQAREQLSRTNLWLGVTEVPRLFRDKTDDLRARFAHGQLPDGRITPLVPFFEYLDRCTMPRHHLLVTGNAPEIYVYARRPFAAGQPVFIEGYFQSEHEQERQLQRVEGQVVAFVIVLSDQYQDWRTSFPRLDAYVASRFRQLTDIPVDAMRTVHVLVHAGLPPTGVDPVTTWPCYR